MGVIVFLVGLASHYSGFLEPLEWKAWDVRLGLLASQAEADNDIVLILVDQYSLDVFEKHQGLGWPWPRQIQAALINYLHQGRARAIFLDFIFSEGSSYGVEDDQYLAEAMRAAGNVFLPFSLSSQEMFYQEVPQEVLTSLAFPPERLPPRSYPSAKGVSLPLRLFLDACQGAGNVFFRPDSDGIFRRLPLAFSFKEFLLPSLPLVLAEGMIASSSSSSPPPPPSWNHLPLDDKGRLIIRYHGPAGSQNSF